MGRNHEEPHHSPCPFLEDSFCYVIAFEFEPKQGLHLHFKYLVYGAVTGNTFFLAGVDFIGFKFLPYRTPGSRALPLTRRGRR